MRTSLCVCTALAVVCASSAMAQSDWTRKSVFSPRENRSVAYDPLRYRGVLFGGLESNGRILGDTWEWDGAAWTERFPLTLPTARRGTALVWDEVRHTVLMFGGRSATAYLNDTWEWDGLDWHQLAPATSPPARADSALAWDPLRQRAVLFGGQGTTLRSDTWEWNGADWTQVVTAVTPNAVSRHSLVFDHNLGKVLLIADGFSFDSWTWDGSTWTHLSPATEPVGANHAVAWDDNTQRVVMFGGGTDPTPLSTALDQTWEWDGTNWSEHLLANPPPARDSGALFFDSLRGELVLFGGVERQYWVHNSDTWSWDGALWYELSHSEGPQAGARPAMVFDAARAETVLVDGSQTGSGLQPDDTWTWNGQRWTKLDPSPRPALRYNHGLAYDSARQRVVLFGGHGGDVGTQFDDTWEWNGAAWTKLLPATRPSLRDSHAMAYDSARGVVVLFGGTFDPGIWLSDTWEWNGTDWTQRTPVTTPPPRLLHAMAYDDARHVVVMYGGLGMNDTWEWNGTDWTQRNPAASPTLQSRCSMAYDTARSRVVLFGGSTASGTVSELWEWDGTTWTQAAAPVPTPRRNTAMTYDSVRGRLVLFGGSVGSPANFIAETWEYGDLDRAANTTIGTACAGPIAPVLTAYGLPTLGNGWFGLDLVHGAANAAALFGVAAGDASIPLGPCTVHLTAPLIGIPIATNSGGFAHLAVPLPLIAAYSGIDLFSQGFVLDASAPLGVALTAGLRWTLGE